MVQVVQIPHSHDSDVLKIFSVAEILNFPATSPCAYLQNGLGRLGSKNYSGIATFAPTGFFQARSRGQNITHTFMTLLDTGLCPPWFYRGT
jgi:hypothetical protein